MNTAGPIVIVDDDQDDLEIFHQTLLSMGISNEIILFDQASKFLEHMRTVDENVFFILCDINMPEMDGFQLRDEILRDDELAHATIPFIFFSTSGEMNHVVKAYKKSIQGYFKKPASLREIKAMFECIICYWTFSSHPVRQ